MKRSFSEMSNEELIDIKDDIYNLENGLGQLATKQYDDNESILRKMRIFEFIVVVQIFILWSLILKTYK
jgi:hypothetical protein